jgi:hypothetical protein
VFLEENKKGCDLSQPSTLPTAWEQVRESPVVLVPFVARTAILIYAVLVIFTTIVVIDLRVISSLTAVQSWGRLRSGVWSNSFLDTTNARSNQQEKQNTENDGND